MNRHFILAIFIQLSLWCSPSACQDNNELVNYETCSWGYRGNPADCGTYYQCNFGASLLRECPPGLFWNPDVNTCDWPTSVRSGVCHDRSGVGSDPADNREAGEDDTVIIQLRAKCEEGTFLKSTRDCGTFFVCNHGHYVAQQCGAGLHYNAQLHICDWPVNAGCVSSGSEPDIPPPATTTTTTSTTLAPVVVVPVTPEPVDNSSPPSSSSSGRKVVCYFTDWAWYRPGKGKYLPDNIDPSLCTHVVYAFALLSGNDFTIQPADTWADFDNKFYAKVTGLKSRGTKVTLALGGWNESGGSKYSTMVNDPSKRAAFIKSAVAYLSKHNFDGLDLDWEYPRCWQGNCNGPVSDKSAFATFVKECREALPKGAILSVAVSASKIIIDQAYDVPTIAKYVDWIGVMDYDFHGNWDKMTGHIAPMYYSPGDSSDFLNVDYSIQYWIRAGAPRSKLVMGIPLYGQTFTLADAKNNGLNAPTYGPGAAGEFTRQGGVLAYYEICATSWTKTVQSGNGNMGPYSYSGTQWVSYDDVAMVRRKSQYIKKMGLAGGMIWALDFDDFTNTCGKGKYPLLTAITKTLRP